jgi:hypothetical protein
VRASLVAVSRELTDRTPGGNRPGVRRRIRHPRAHEARRDPCDVVKDLAEARLEAGGADVAAKPERLTGIPAGSVRGATDGGLYATGRQQDALVTYQRARRAGGIVRCRARSGSAGVGAPCGCAAPPSTAKARRLVQRRLGDAAGTSLRWTTVNSGSRAVNGVGPGERGGELPPIGAVGGAVLGGMLGSSPDLSGRGLQSARVVVRHAATPGTPIRSTRIELAATWRAATSPPRSGRRRSATVPAGRPAHHAERHRVSGASHASAAQLVAPSLVQMRPSALEQAGR